jgi:hypothetical protein
MVKVAKMRRAKRILLIGGMFLAVAGTADARIWGSRKADKPAVSAEAAPTVVLSAVDVEGSRVILRTNGAPAYTSYSPSPGVFVVDLTGTTRDAGAVVPSTLPPAVASIAAEEVTEMGSSLTRITFRLAQLLTPEVTAIEKAVVVTVPATAIPIETASAEEVLPIVTPSAAPQDPPAVQTTSIEPIAETVPEIAEPVARVEEIALPRARSVKRIDAKTTGGNVEVRISGDGQLKYKAFRLDNPARLVIDLEGVKNAAPKNSVTVDDDVVQRVRVAQFQPGVARVVVDLARKTDYDIAAVGDEVRVAFGSTARASRETPAPVQPAPVKVAQAEASAPRVESTPVKSAPADIPSQVPTIAENAPAWNVPETPAPARRESVSKGARSRITPAADQAPAQQPPTQEDVFGDVTIQSQGGPVQTLAGSRTLSSSQRVFNGEPISLNLKDADIKDVIRTFAELTGLNIAVDPGVAGAVTVDFVDVPWDQALDLILRQNNLT